MPAFPLFFHSNIAIIGGKKISDKTKELLSRLLRVMNDLFTFGLAGRPIINPGYSAIRVAKKAYKMDVNPLLLLATKEWAVLRSRSSLRLAKFLGLKIHPASHKLSNQRKAEMSTIFQIVGRCDAVILTGNTGRGRYAKRVAIKKRIPFIDLTENGAEKKIRKAEKEVVWEKKRTINKIKGEATRLANMSGISIEYENLSEESDPTDITTMEDLVETAISVHNETFV